MSEGNPPQDDVNYSKPEGIVKELYIIDCRLFLYAKHTGYQMTVRGATVTGTVLPAMEFSDFLCACYNFTPPNLEKSDGCSWYFSIHHGLTS